MRYLIGIVAVLLITGAAQARPDARAMTCEAARQMVLQRGAVVMTTGRHTYQRFVSHRQYCDYWERTKSAWTATRDEKKCRIGYICVDRPDRDDRRDRFRWLHRR
jgi:hypothetical protein